MLSLNCSRPMLTLGLCALVLSYLSSSAPAHAKYSVSVGTTVAGQGTKSGSFTAPAINATTVALATLPELSVTFRKIDSPDPHYLRVVCTVKNEGPRDSGRFTTLVRIQHYLGIGYLPTGQQEFHMRVPAWQERSFYYDVPITETTGWLQAFVDAYEQVAEADETNNLTQWTIGGWFGLQ